MSFDKIRNELVNNFYDNSVMLNVAMNIEQFLCDEVVLYPYAGWFAGELVSGPVIGRYHVTIILKYDYVDMPDPEGALVLNKFGVKVYYKKSTEKIIDEEKTEESNEILYKNVKIWLVKLVIPKDLVSDENFDKELDVLDNMLDMETIEAGEGAEGDSNMEGGLGGGFMGGDFGGGGNLSGADNDFGGMGDMGDMGGVGGDMGGAEGDAGAEAGGEGPFDAGDIDLGDEPAADTNDENKP